MRVRGFRPRNAGHLGSMHSLSLSHTAPDPPGGVMAVAETDSVRVSWESVGDADSYTVTLSQAQGAEQDGLCSTESHSFTLSEIMATFASVPIGQDVGPSETGMLRAYTTYVVTVKTVSAVRGTSQDSQRRTVLTPQTSETLSLSLSVSE